MTAQLYKSRDGKRIGNPGYSRNSCSSSQSMVKINLEFIPSYVPFPLVSTSSVADCQILVRYNCIDVVAAVDKGPGEGPD